MQVSEKTRSYLLVVKQTLLNTVPKAIVFHQVKQAEEHLLSGLQVCHFAAQWNRLLQPPLLLALTKLL